MIIEPGNCRERREEREKKKKKKKEKKKGNRSDRPGVLVNEPVGGKGA
jgi:hypothetical protein